MANKPVPPYRANPDGKSCGQCVFGMILDYFLPDGEWTMEKMNALCGAVPGKYTWGFRPVVELAKHGLEIKSQSKFDVEQFISDPQGYLVSLYGQAGAEDNIRNSDIGRIVTDAKELLSLNSESYAKIHKYFTAADLRRYLDDGYLLNLWVNSSRLNGGTAYTGHFILVYDHDDSGFFAHDPGGREGDKPCNQYPSRYIKDNDLIAAASPQIHGQTSSMLAIREGTHNVR